MPYAANEGIRLYYDVEGQGPPLVLIHGIGGTHEDWAEMGWVAALKDRYRLVLPDGRGHGRSDKPHDPDVYGPIHQAQDHVAVLDDLGIEQAHFLGFSMGGNVALNVGVYAPDRCLSLLLAGTQPYARDERPPSAGLPVPKPFAGVPEGKNPIDRLLEQGGTAWLGFVAANIDVSPDMKQRLLANDFDAVLARFNALYIKDLDRYLEAIQMPCLICVGEDEPAYAGARWLAERLPDAEFVAFPGLHHYDMLTRLDVVLPEMLRFLGAVPG